MTPFNVVLPDLDALDSEKLKALVVEKHALVVQHHALVIEKEAELASQHDEIERLKLFVLKLQRMQFGPSSERLARQIDQLELQLEELETTKTAKPTAVVPQAVPAKPPARKPLPAELPRETETLQPKETACPDCGGTLKHLGEDASEMLEFVPSRFKVIRTVRPKLACNRCDAIVQEPAPHRPIDRGLAGPGLLAHVLTGKYCDHLPLYRAIGNLCTRRNRARPLDTRGLGWRREPYVGTVGRCDPKIRAGGNEDSRRRYTGSGTGARNGQDKDRSSMDLRS